MFVPSSRASASRLGRSRNELSRPLPTTKVSSWAALRATAATPLPGGAWSGSSKMGALQAPPLASNSVQTEPSSPTRKMSSWPAFRTTAVTLAPGGA